MNAMPLVEQCAETSCAFNQNGCNALAMTMGQHGCVTFLELTTRPSLTAVQAGVGACQRLDCTFNKGLECSANVITVGAADANCLTFQAA